MKEFWDERFSRKEYVYGTKPNKFFEEQLGKITAGKILLPAEGEGRNAVFAAKQGWDVTAFDISEAGKNKALQLADSLDVKVNYLISSFKDFEVPLESFDCIGLFFAHMPIEMRPVIHKKLVQYLKPNGVLLLEGFSKEQLGKDSGGPQNIDMLFSKEDLQNDFSELSKLEVYKTEAELEEGKFHSGSASLIRLTGIK